MMIRALICGVVAVAAPLIATGAGSAGAMSAEARRADDEARAILDAALPGAEERPDVLLLGTFHFVDAGLDSYKPRHQLDILGEQRQREIEELLKLLATWAPTKVCVEVKRDQQERLDARYQEYLAGTFELSGNEVFQIGFRLAKMLGHERVHAIDADGRWHEPRADKDAWAAGHGQEWLTDQELFAKFMGVVAQMDERKTKETIRETLLFLNSPTLLEASHGAYVSGMFMQGDGKEYPGPDGFLSHWMNRNMRIFANIRQLAAAPEERVLVVIGQGHVPLIRHALVSSVELDLVEAHEVLAPAGE